MFSFATICPHPPIILPTIGSKEDIQKVQKTIEGMEKLEQEMKKVNPETLILISPHGPVGFKEMGLITALHLPGSLSMFGDFVTQFSFENNEDICEKIQKESKKKGVPLKTYNAGELDHGMLVPLYYLTKNLKPKIVPMAYSLLDNSTHFLFGKILGKIAKEEKNKIGIVASGDLSHRLLPSAPAGYSPRGKEFDEKLVELLKENNTEGILKMDENLIEEAGECGYKSIIILLGALSELKNWKFKILSYEGPFGVGYLVANIEGL
jgi:aromatic ring-opening dioxygenase LigB subunit